MNRNQIAMAAVSGVTSLILVGCSVQLSGAPLNQSDGLPASQQLGSTQLAQGYPINRNLESVLTWRDLDTVVVLDSLSFQESAELSPGLWEGMNLIVTPITAIVRSRLFGTTKNGDSITFTVAGGGVGADVLDASDELAPSIQRLKDATRIVVAGQLRETAELGVVLDPIFVYSLNDAGMLKSLLSSGGSGPTYPSFSLADLTSGLDLRASR